MKSLLELNAEVNSKPTLDDLVEAIIFKARQTRPPKSQAFFQQAFFQLQKDNYNLFSEMIFDESGITPFSDELDSILFRLEASGVLHTINPSYQSYIIENSVDILEESYNKLSSISSEIDKSASLFSKLVKKSEAESNERE